MITQQVTAIALRLFSIWLLIQLILNLPSFVMLFASVEQYQQQEIPMGAYVGLIGAFILVGLIAVFLINKAANSVLNSAKSDSEATLSSDSQKVLFQLAGLYFVVNALAYLPRSLSFIPNTIEISASSILWPAGLVFQLAIGLWLVSASTFWLNLFNKLRGRA
jgi:large-conductance mechanosensitive channel